MVIVFVAILVGLTIPSLQSSRVRARNVRCLSNLRQLQTAWTAYSVDQNSFPIGPVRDYWQIVRHGWGGVHWYLDLQSTPLLSLPADRPINPYVVGSPSTGAHAGVFECPSDTGAALARTGLREWDTIAVGLNSSRPASIDPKTCYGASGNSYAVNHWLYCVPESPNGWGAASGGAPPPRYRSNQGLQHVQVSADRLVVIEDAGTIGAAKYTPARRLSQNIFTGFWHGEEWTQSSFLDGSARRRRAGAVVTSGATYLLYEPELPYAGWSNPNSP